LKPKGFNTEILEDIRVFFKECDIARFTPSQQQRGDMQQLLNQAKNIVEYFKRR
jgi:hypothetical protein